MNVRCPYCHQLFDHGAEMSLQDVRCPHCQRPFHLVSGPAAGNATMKTVGHFRLMNKVGSGGFGEVWKAHDEQLDRIVAIKVPHRELLSPSHTEMWMKEARSAARVEHRHILRVHEFGRDNNVVFIVCEFIEGGSLENWAPDETHSFRQIATVIAKVAGAVQAAHDSDIVHRDLKPSNILVDSAGEPRVTDFGLALHTPANVTVTHDGRVVGTPAYMSPEQARSASRANRLSDVYSLGAILYRLLAGRPPFEGTALGILQQVQDKNLDPVAPRQLNPDVPVDLESICLQAMNKEPHRRYRSAAEFAEDLRSFAEGRPVKARPVGHVERAWRWSRRNPRLASSLCAIMLLVTLLLLVTAGAAALFRQKQMVLMRELQLKNDARLKSAQLAMGRGAWNDALRSTDQLLAEGFANDAAIWADRIKAFSGLGRGADALAEANDILQSGVGDELADEMRLWQVDSIIGHDVDHATVQLEQLVKDGRLSAASRDYAKGLVAKTLPDARDCFSRAMTTDPTHFRANYFLAISHMLLGELPEAERRVAVAQTLFVEDPNTRLLGQLLSAFRGELTRAQGVSQQLQKMDRVASDDSLVAISLMAQGEGLPDAGETVVSKKFIENFSLPPVLAEGVNALLTAGGELGKRMYTAKPGYRPSEAELQRLRDQAELLPVGIVKLGVAAWETGDRQGQLLHDAQTTPSPVDTLELATWLYFWIFDDLFQKLQSPSPEELPGLRTRGIGYVQDVLAIREDQLKKLKYLDPKLVFGAAAGVALRAERPDLAEELTARMKGAPPERRLVGEADVNFLRIRAAMNTGAYGRAIEAATTAINSSPVDARLKGILEEARAALRRDYQRFVNSASD